VLGRLTNRTEPDLTSNWTYDTQTKGIGKLATASTTAGFQRTISYDSLGRPVTNQVTADSTSYTTTSTYDIGGRIGTVTYPSGFGVTYTYNTTGYLTQISGGSPSVNYWTANSYDAEAHLTQATAGNGVVTISAWNPDTGRISTIQAGTSASVQNLSFTFNTLGNLTQRVDGATSTTDTLSYDGLNRLTQAVISNPGLPLNVTKTVTYDDIGNITNKSDVGDYAYDPVHVHAVSGITPGATGTLTASYTYDGDGNMLTGKGRTITWTSFDMVSQIVLGTNSVGFTYDSEHARLKETNSDGSTKYYLNDPISGIMQEKVIGASLAVSWNDYVMKGGEMVALHVTATSPQIRYFHKDHLGSIVALTDETGAVVERDSYDAWGERRQPAGPDDPLYPSLSLTSQITRGYTGHEQLDTVGLVHMNGRIYDPVIGKMMSADPTVPNPIDQQAYNRYAYVGNSPLSFTDPTGFINYDPRDKSDGPEGGRSVGRDDRDNDGAVRAEVAHALGYGSSVGDAVGGSGGTAVVAGTAGTATAEILGGGTGVGTEVSTGEIIAGVLGAPVEVVGALAGAILVGTSTPTAPPSKDMLNPSGPGGIATQQNTVDEAKTTQGGTPPAGAATKPDAGASTPAAPPAQSPEITADDLRGKTKEELEQLAKDKGLVPDPNKPGRWRDPVTGKERMRIDPGHFDKQTGKPFDDPNAAVDHAHGYGPDGKQPVADPLNDGNKHFPLR
jgi:RHS repeat-associated protein